jgi:glycosyltransferase involved in cell wall biosynthesis
LEFSLLSLLTLFRRPRIVVLDLRFLQCGYANRGIGRCSLELALQIQAWSDSGAGKGRYQIHSLVMEGPVNPLPEIPVLITAPQWKRPWVWDQVWLPWLLFINRVFVFHSFAALGPLPQISFPVLCRRRGIAHIQDWHMFSEAATDIEKFYRSTWRIRIQKRGLPKIHRIVVHSEVVRHEAIMHGVPAERITLVPLGCDHLDRVKAEAWNMENFALSVGDTPNKNIPFTHAVLCLMRSRFIHLNWVIIGNRQEVLKQLQLVEEKLPEWITVLESPSDRVLKACYQKSLALLFPSTKEGFGIPLLEAMRLGCPVLAPDCEPMKSLLDYSASLLPIGDTDAWSKALNRLLQDNEARRMASEAGRLRALEFTWNKVAQKILTLYPA